MTLSPMGYYYRFSPTAPVGQRLVRKRHLEQPWEAGKPEFSVQTMTGDELRFVAAVIDDARVGVVSA